MKANAEAELADAQSKLAQEEASRQELNAEKKRMEGGISSKKKDVDDVRLALQKVDQEKNSRDHAIKGLNDEIAEQDEMINRLNKEKRMVSEHGAKSAEELQSANDN